MSRKRLKADVAVIGAGSGGLSIAAGAAQLGVKVVLFEKGEMGGDCLNTGCVPSKALIAAADAAHAVRTAGKLGVRAGEPEIDFAAVMAHVHGAIADIAPHDSQTRFEGLGVTVVREAARFTGHRTLESASVSVTARKVVIATGSHPKVPPVPGLEKLPYVTNETVFGLTERPRRLLVMGAGAIGMELGQAFRRLGSDVVVIEAAPDALAREDRDLAEVVLAQLRADGVEVMTRTEVLRAEATQDGLVLQVKGPEGDERWIEGSHLLVAAGRRPVVEGMDLDAGDVAHDQTGVHVDKRLRSISNPAVFAVGDVVGREMFTHAAGAHASLFVRKALFAQRVDLERLLIPRVTYTDPELAAVGLTEAQARQRFGEAAKVITAPFSGNDRAVAEGDTRGFGKLITHKGKIVGAALVGRGAGDLIQPFVLAMASRLKLSALTGYVAPYPTRGEIVKRLAGAYFTPILFSGRTRMLVSLLKRLG